MKTRKFNEPQIVSILKQQESGLKVADICREHGISQATFYKWRSKVVVPEKPSIPLFLSYFAVDNRS